MIIKTQWIENKNLTLSDDSYIIKVRFFIPENKHGINEGYYSINEIVSMLRTFKQDPVKIQFIADMLED